MAAIARITAASHKHTLAKLEKRSQRRNAKSAALKHVSCGFRRTSPLIACSIIFGQSAAASKPYGDLIQLGEAQTLTSGNEYQYRKPMYFTVWHGGCGLFNAISYGSGRVLVAQGCQFVLLTKTVMQLLISVRAAQALHATHCVLSLGHLSRLPLQPSSPVHACSRTTYTREGTDED